MPNSPRKTLSIPSFLHLKPNDKKMKIIKDNSEDFLRGLHSDGEVLTAATQYIPEFLAALT